MNIDRLERECTQQNNALSCSVAGNSLKTYNPTVQGSHVDLQLAVRYYAKGCSLGELTDCFYVGEAFQKGEGVDKDQLQAVSYLKRSCESSTALGNTMQGFACVDLGQALLDVPNGYSENYDAAMGAFEKACSYQPSTCSVRNFYKGTGLQASSSAPAGAFGFGFGINHKAAIAVCRGNGGTVQLTGDTEMSCQGYQLAALENERAEYLHLTFCGDSLCSILVALHPPQDRYVKRYADLKARLVEGYGPAGKLVRAVPAECRNDAQLPTCIEKKRATFSGYWEWPTNETVSIQLTAVDSDVRVLLGYDSAERTKAIKSWGL